MVQVSRSFEKSKDREIGIELYNATVVKDLNYLIFGMTAFLGELESRIMNKRHNAVDSPLKRTPVDA